MPPLAERVARNEWVRHGCRQPGSFPREISGWIHAPGGGRLGVCRRSNPDLIDTPPDTLADTRAEAEETVRQRRMAEVFSQSFPRAGTSGSRPGAPCCDHREPCLAGLHASDHAPGNRHHRCRFDVADFDGVPTTTVIVPAGGLAHGAATGWTEVAGLAYPRGVPCPPGGGWLRRAVHLSAQVQAFLSKSS